MILNSWLLSQKCRQRERTSLRDGLRLPSNEDDKTSTSICNEARRFILYVYKFSAKTADPVKSNNQLSVILN